MTTDTTLSLPDFSHLAGGISKGRSIRDGYTRGWGLQFGDLRAQIAADGLYQEALELSMDRTVQSEDNRMNMYLLNKIYLKTLPMGHIVEFGSYKGGSAIFMARVCQELHPEMKVYAFDTFSGMPETDPEIDAHGAGDFDDVDFDELQDYIHSIGLTNLILVRGLFNETAASTLKNIGKVRMNHIDCDIRSAAAYSYDVTIPHMVEGGYVVLDDALYSSCIGATEVVEDLFIRRDGLNSEQIFPHYVFRAPF